MGVLLTATICQARYTFEYQDTLPLSVGEIGAARPVALTIDQLGDEVCVTDARQSVFHLINAHDVEVFRSSTVARLSMPADGSIDARGNIVFTDRGASYRNVIRRLNVFGEPQDYRAESPDSTWSPQHLVILRDGSYLTLDTTSGTLAKHDPVTGALLWQRVVTGDRTQTAMGRPAEAPDGRIYIPGGDLRDVMVLTATGEPIENFGRFGSAPGRMSFPVGIAFGPDGEVFVLDSMCAKVLVFDRDHEFITEFGTLGFRPGQLYHPLAIAASAEGRIYVAQGFQGRVQVFQMTRQE